MRRFVKTAPIFFSLMTIWAQASAGESCTDNFTSSGNFLTGQTYKTSAVLAGVSQGEAFSRAQVFTAANGFTILAADRQAGVISAAQTASLSHGKTMPLSITVQGEGGGSKISMQFSLKGGAYSPVDAVKRHMCLTVAAAASSAVGESTPAPAPAVAVAPAARAPQHGYATPTAAQQQRLRAELVKNALGARISAMVKQAGPSIAPFLQQVSCLADTSYSARDALNIYAAPGAQLMQYNNTAPMHAAKYHHKGSCLTVARVHGWQAPANNALRFEVMYVADDSGEVMKLEHEVVRQPDGAWLFTK